MNDAPASAPAAAADVHPLVGELATKHGFTVLRADAFDAHCAVRVGDAGAELAAGLCRCAHVRRIEQALDARSSRREAGEDQGTMRDGLVTGRCQFAAQRRSG